MNSFIQTVIARWTWMPVTTIQTECPFSFMLVFWVPREKGRMRGYNIRQSNLYYPLSLALSRWEREFKGK
jgi:hypothetical protein